MTRQDAGAEAPEQAALRWERSDGVAVDHAIRADRPVTIGREPTNTVAISSPFVSKAHAILRYQTGRYVIEDLKSANGTRVNGEPVSTANVSVGDVIEVGDERFVVVDRTAPVPHEVRAGLNKTAKLALAGAGSAVVCLLLLTLLMMAKPPVGDQRAAVNRSTSGNATDPKAPTGRRIASASQVALDVIRRAQSTGVNPVDELVDEGMLLYRVGRLRESVEMFSAAVSRDPGNELARGRFQATTGQLSRTIDIQIGEAERAFSQLRLDDAAAKWEQVLQLTDAGDPRHDQAGEGLNQVHRRWATR